MWAKNTRVPARKVVQRAEFRAAGRPVPSAARVMAEARRDETTYAAFREVGRVIRTVQLLGYLSDAPLSRMGDRGHQRGGVVQPILPVDRLRQPPWRHRRQRPIEQERATNFNALLTNAVISHNALDTAEIVGQLLEEG